ncbi:uncharacterized, partial [Tachysurus ichikawai]
MIKAAWRRRRRRRELCQEKKTSAFEVMNSCEDSFLSSSGDGIRFQ